MIPLVAVMLRARWAAALTLVLLALFATAAAVAGPAYLGAVDRSVVRQEVTAAAPNERSLSATTAFYLLAGGAPNIDLTGLASSLVALPGVQVVYSAEIAVLGTRAAPPGVSRLVSRQDVCSHLVIVAGRCVTGVSEAVLGEATARRLKVGPGDVLTLTDAVSNPDPAKPGYVPAGKPAPLTVAGKPVYDTATLVAACAGLVPEDVLARVDAVAVLPPFDAERLKALALLLGITDGADALVEACAGQVPEPVLARVDAVAVLPAFARPELEQLASLLCMAEGAADLVTLAMKSSSPARELCALIARLK